MPENLPNQQQSQAGSQQPAATPPPKEPEKAKNGAKGPAANAAEEVNIGELLLDIVKLALEKKSSDIHIEPTEKIIYVRFRIDGILQDITQLEKHLEEPLIFKIKIQSKLRTDEHFAPQDGRIRFELGEGKRVDTRISILPTTGGEKVVMRILSQDGKSFTLQDLGIIGKDYEAVEKAYNKPYGTILTVGPTGSGKTTTLYSILKILNTRERNITTVEDPVEYSIEGVNHVQINNKANLTFAEGLRSILRQDPDVVMVGEIRDGETARIATNAAMTGHLVLSTLHTNDSVTTIPRLIDMGIEDFLVASTVNLVIAQRLARKICSQCKQPYTITDQHMASLNRIRPDIASLIKVGETFMKEQGCGECTSGYKGRIGLYEILQITKNIRRVITEGGNSDDIFKIAREEGLETILEDGVKKARSGLTTLSEVIRVTALKV